jgi:hypothetical protein
MVAEGACFFFALIEFVFQVRSESSFFVAILSEG